MAPDRIAKPLRLLTAALIAAGALLGASFPAEAASRQARIAAEARRIATAWKATGVVGAPGRAARLRGRHQAGLARGRSWARQGLHRPARVASRRWAPRPKPWALAWVPPARQVVPTPPPPLYLGDLYVASSEAPLLQRPASGAPRLARLLRRTVVTNMGQVGGYHKVEAPNGAVGYVSSRALSVTPPVW